MDDVHPMRSTSRSPRRRFLLPVGLLLATAAAPASAAEAGRPFTCEASVLRGTLLTAPAIEPLVVNRGKACGTSVVGGADITRPLPFLTADVLFAATQRTGPDGRSDLQQNGAVGGVGNLGVGSLASLGLALPLDQIALPLPPIPAIDITPVATLLNTADALLNLLPPVPNTVRIDVNAALKELLKLPATDLLRVQAAVAQAGAGCVAGSPAMFGQRSVTGLSVLGNSIDVDTVGDRPIIDTQTIDPSAIDLTRVKVPLVDALLPLQGGLLGGVVTSAITQIQALVASTVAALPPIAVPIQLAQVSVKPGTRTRTATSLTQTALEVKVRALGQDVVDLVLGEAKVGTAGVDCTPPTGARAEPPEAGAPTVAAQAPLSCTSRRLVLTDVVRKDDRVTILGVADKRLVGRFVTIRFEGDGLTAGRALVASDGTFKTTAALPAERLRSSNRARYQAVLGKEKSLNLKLERRMLVERLGAEDGKVTIRGRVTRPLATPRQTITLTRRVSCKRSEVVKRFKPEADGTFSVTVAAPKGQASAVYRLGTRVRKSTTNPKLYPTFTLPRGVALAR
ncbi:MAG: hypothetical protein JWO90_287 [Solirubrobacterales bacterium]|nr:hypothetical protein [Solirubrobacterales bacterium]